MPEVILNMLPLKEEERAAFEAAAPQAIHLYAGRKTVTEEQLAQATVIFGSPKPEDLPKAVNLKWFQSMWAGTDEYTQPNRIPAGAMLTCSSGSNSRSVAEHMLASLLALYRQLPACRDQQKAHVWKDFPKMKTMLGAFVLVVGAGNVGADFAQLCKALGAETTVGVKRSASGPIPGFDRVCTLDQLDELIPQADVVALTLPHSEQTRGIMSRARLEAMKDDAVLLNGGRGTALDQEALVQLMMGGKLWGAALDVTDPEPLPADSPLWDVPNLILTPHVAGGMRLELTRRNCVGQALENLNRYQAGQPLKNVVIPK